MINVVLFEKDEVFLAEKVRNFCSILEHPLRPRTYNTLNSSNHSSKMNIVKENIFGPQLSDNTTYTPYIDFSIITIS